MRHFNDFIFASLSTRRPRWPQIARLRLMVSLFNLYVFIETQFEYTRALTNITFGSTCCAKFHASEASTSEKEQFNVPVWFYGSSQERPGKDRCWTVEPVFKKLDLGQQFQAAEPSSSVEDFKVHFTCKPRSPVIGPFWTNLGKDYQTMLHTTFQVFEPRNS